MADEPTANLDSHNGHETMRLLRRIAKEENRSIIIVSHDERIRNIADRILWLEDGQFKDATQMSLDPRFACGMSVDPKNAPAHTTINGKTFYFCARGCRDEFLEMPAINHKSPSSASFPAKEPENQAQPL